MKLLKAASPEENESSIDPGLLKVLGLLVHPEHHQVWDIPTDEALSGPKGASLY